MLKQIDQQRASTRGSAVDLWRRAQAARSRGNLISARQLSSLAVSAFRATGQGVKAWSGAVDMRLVALAPDGSQLVAAAPEQGLLLLETRHLRPTVALELPAHDARSVTQASFAPDGSRLAVSTTEGVRLFDVHDGKLIDTWSWADVERPNVAFSADGSSIYVAGGAGSRRDLLRVDAKSGAVLATHNFPKATYPLHLVASADGRRVVAASAEGVEVFSASGLEKLRDLGNFSRLSAVAASPKGDRLATISSRGLEVWDLDSGTRRAHAVVKGTSAASLFGFSSDGSRVRVSDGSLGDSLLEFDATSGKPLGSKPLPGRDGLLSADGDVLVSQTLGGRLDVIHGKTGTVTARTPTSERLLVGAALTEGALALARRDAEKNEIQLFLVDTQHTTGHFVTTTGDRATLAWSPDATYLAGNFGGHSVLLWDRSRQHRALPDFPNAVDALALGNGRLQGVGGPFKLTVASLDLDSTTWKRRLERPRDADRRAITISGDGKVLVTVSNRGTELVGVEDTNRGALLAEECKRGPVSASSTGSKVLVACGDEVRLISASDRIESAHRAKLVSLSPHGDRSLVSEGAAVLLLDEQLKPRATLWFRGPRLVEARNAGGDLELLGTRPENQWFCFVGRRAYPFELCEDQLIHDDLVVDALLPD